MAKFIALEDDVYAVLKRIKDERKKSFSKVMIELIEEKKRKSVSEFIGIWKDDAKYWDNFKKEIRKGRDKAKMREIDIK